MGEPFNLCIIKPNKNAFSETFIQEHIDRLPGNKKVLYGGAFPVYDHQGNYLIKSKLGLLSYLLQKKLWGRLAITVRTNALIKYLKEQHIDVVFAEYGMVGASVTQACKQAGVPLVIHYHGADVYHRDTVAKYLSLYKDAFAYASAFIAVSVEMVGQLSALGAPADKIYLAPCGVDTDAFALVDISKTPKAFLSVGRFVEKKSPESVVKAFKLVADRFSDAGLTMVGDGPRFEQVRKLISTLGLQGQVTLTGVLKTAQIKELLQQSRCFVQHSVTAVGGDKEGTPVTILEAGSSGLAIVSTQHSGIMDAVIHGETGYLVAEHDIQSMARYMIQIAEDAGLAAALGKKEAAHIRQHYDIRDSINTLSDILYKAIKTD